jgi:hypothetical protein
MHVPTCAPYRMCCMQSLLGLQHMHSKKIIHRDIKALNLFIDYQDKVKVCVCVCVRMFYGPF